MLPRDPETRLPQAEGMRLLKGFFSQHRKTASLARPMDGFTDGGPVWDLVVQPVNEAGNAEAVKNEIGTLALNKIFSRYSNAEIRKMYAKEFIPGATESLTKMGQIMVALNWSNTDNGTKLIEGRGWAEH